MLFSMFILVLFTFFVGSIGISFSQEPIDFDIFYKLLILSMTFYIKIQRITWIGMNFLQMQLF
ncbi:NADH-ubiquinone oxidoreductase (complex I), chain 5 carboxy-terminal protein [Medicago truncatula]|uniref:NAD(P)H-quinone oxidoreductase subunit 5, chloroplastic n=1 Tax=Medicago truncatula TaxID=3880 RepID=G7KJ69_MEDTR|nr:NADH-ubiquinone oxidoreductase (complex I), chain 5 carboxy-terminal protein [Medicago truncatula]